MKRKKALRDLFNLQGGFCAYCDKKMDITRCNTKDAPSLDHIVPRKHGGTNEKHNLVCACVECNCKKGHMPLVDFLIVLKQRKLKAA